MTTTTGDGHDDGVVVVAWLQRDDGSWWAVDGFGTAWPVKASTPTLAELDAHVQAALGTIGDPIDVAPLSVVDTVAAEAWRSETRGGETVL
ncbi:hypothetical protein [Nocardia sp. CNY236]|uniref:hypothetical protein n=1 Tax=Nocardia sp. CNY236 TaxID=1169152 RepID=UPI00040DA899|nr:hypothetical protein [Nocardia sp. CNY236]